jgi:hypothetical protein
MTATTQDEQRATQTFLALAEQVMRDHFDHSELVPAGMWGGVRSALPPLSPAIRDWFAKSQRVLGRFRRPGIPARGPLVDHSPERADP